MVSSGMVEITSRTLMEKDDDAPERRFFGEKVLPATRFPDGGSSENKELASGAVVRE
jgi:hypothetical protein